MAEARHTLDLFLSPLPQSQRLIEAAGTFRMAAQRLPDSVAPDDQWSQFQAALSLQNLPRTEEELYRYGGNYLRVRQAILDNYFALVPEITAANVGFLPLNFQAGLTVAGALSVSENLEIPSPGDLTTTLASSITAGSLYISGASLTCSSTLDVGSMSVEDRNADVSDPNDDVTPNFVRVGAGTAAPINGGIRMDAGITCQGVGLSEQLSFAEVRALGAGTIFFENDAGDLEVKKQGIGEADNIRSVLTHARIDTGWFEIRHHGTGDSATPEVLPYFLSVALPSQGAATGPGEHLDMNDIQVWVRDTGPQPWVSIATPLENTGVGAYGVQFAGYSANGEMLLRVGRRSAHTSAEAIKQNVQYRILVWLRGSL